MTEPVVTINYPNSTVTIDNTNKSTPTRIIVKAADSSTISDVTVPAHERVTVAVKMQRGDQVIDAATGRVLATATQDTASVTASSSASASTGPLVQTDHEGRSGQPSGVSKLFAASLAALGALCLGWSPLTKRLRKGK